MKKIVLLSLVTLLTTFLWATENNKKLQKPVAATRPSHSYSRNNKPANLRSGTLQKVVIGRAFNVLSVLNANCHQIDVDSASNTVLFVHRADTVYGTSDNGSEYKYDVSTNGGAAWTIDLGPINNQATDQAGGYNGRYPEAVLRPEPANPTNPDSSYIVYNGSWHNGNPTLSVWEGQYYGVGQLFNPPSGYTQHPDTVNNGNVEISTSMIQSTPGHYWNVNMNYTQTSSTTDTIRGIIIESGVWNDSAGEVIWSYQNVTINSLLEYGTGGTPVGNMLYNPTISFDPTGQYGWIVIEGDIVNDNHFAVSPIYMSSSDYGQTWTAPQSLALDNLPGMFPTSSSATNGGKTIVGDAQVVVDSAGNPHIFALVGQGDTTSNEYSFYIFQTMVLYDLYYNPAVAGCSWQANMLSQVFGYSGDYTSDSYGDANRIQASRTKDGKKIFVFWTDTDSSTVASVAASGSSSPLTNPAPNLFGIGINMSSRKITDVMDFTAGDPLFGGALPSLGIAGGTFQGALFPVVSPNVLNVAGGNYNIPTTLTQPDYLTASVSAWLGTNPAQFYYCQNINFNDSEFINKFDNAPPTLSIDSFADTVFVLLGQPYVQPRATAYDCQYGNITPLYSSTVPTNAQGNTDSAGVFSSTWTATNPAGNTASQTEVVIVTGPPIARMYYVAVTGYRFDFTDTSLNFPTNRVWNWGDGTSDNLNQVHATKVYTTGGQKCVTLTVSNQYGSSDTTECLIVHLAGINDVDLSAKISVYPNPSASGIITMEMSEDIADGANVAVFNMLGQQVNETISIASGRTQSVLDLSGLETGLYMLKVETSSGTAVKQITISK